MMQKLNKFFIIFLELILIQKVFIEIQIFSIHDIHTS